MSLAGEGSVLRVSHLTRYTYSESVQYSDHKAFLIPRTTPFQELLESRVTTSPQTRHSVQHTDCYGNEFTLFTIDTPHTELRVEADSRLRLGGPDPAAPDDGSGEDLDAVRRRVRRAESGEDLTASEFLFDSPHVWRSPEFAGYGRECFGGGDSLFTGASRLMHRIHSEFRYDPTVTTVSTPVSEVLAHKGGVCQDFAHLMIACLRSLGVPSRYVSGYLVPGPDVIGAQASHAWVSVYCPGRGWTDFDPTNDVSPFGRHVTLAWGRDYSDVSPFRGVVVGGGDHEISVAVSVADA